MNIVFKRRKHPRARPSRSAPIEVQLMSDDFLEVVNALDISIGGMALQVGHCFEGYDIAAEVTILLKLPGTRAIMAKGKIMHTRRSGDAGVFGVQFTELSDDQRTTIADYVNRQCELGFTA
ncbi:MAG: PilZ domain-containing protein [Deltaproteobacteria bacterium]|nr:PilZ domain-containing protein [Deltaproteobacteria bacterium]